MYFHCAENCVQETQRLGCTVCLESAAKQLRWKKISLKMLKFKTPNFCNENNEQYNITSG